MIRAHICLKGHCNATVDKCKCIMPDLNGIDDETKIIRMPDLDYIPDPRGLGCVFFDHMLKYKEKIAQIDTHNGNKDTYGDLLQRCIRTAITMRAKGITSEDIVTICTENHLSSCVPFFATLFLGAKVSALDPTLVLNDAWHLLKQVTPKIIFVMPEALELVEKTVEQISANIKIVVFGQTDKHESFLRYLLPCKEEKKFQPVEAKNQYDTAIIFFSSGTTGLPKGICINHFHLLSQIVNGIRFKFCFDVSLLCTSLYWTTSVYFMGIAILSGSTRLPAPNFNAKNMWNIIDRYKPTFLCFAPNQLLAMVNEECPKNKDISSVKHIATGGAPLVGKHIVAIRKSFPNAEVYPGYGQTEVAMYLLTFKPSSPEEYDLMLKRPTSCGTPIPGLSYKVVDPDTEKIMGPNQEGELRLKTNFICNGYYNQDSSDIWDSDGWYKTGDIVYYDQDKFFYVVDRIKEMFKFQNWHVQPAVLEAILSTHEAIANSVVIGMPHEEDGDHPMAIVVLKSTAKATTPQEIEKFVEDRVDNRKKLRGGVKIVKEIPPTPTGKVRRRDIRAMVLRGELF